MEISKESWDALIAGQYRERMDWMTRLTKMAKQVEKLNWMVGYLGKDDDIVEATADWEEEELYRDALGERRE